MSIGTTAAARWQEAEGQGIWIRTRSWDLTFIILSAVLVSLPLIAYYRLGVSVTAINILVALLVGGPHMYSTYSFTFLERNFLRQHPIYASLALLIPVGVVVLALMDLTLLLTMFMFWASVHVLHQIAWLSDVYRAKGNDSSWVSRAIDYAVIFTCLYPVATYKLVNDLFIIEERALQIPAFLKVQWLPYLVGAVFSVALIAFLIKSYHEYRTGTLLWPKFLLMSITIFLGIFIPTFDNLDVAFQGMNVWHSFQYLALIWWLNKLRKEKGQITNPLIREISGQGRTARFYLFHMGMTVLAGVAIAALFMLSGMSFVQAYYTVILSCLLIHYYFDHFLFTRVEAVVP